MKNFEIPTIEIEKFNIEDVITTSNPTEPGGETGGDDWSGGEF